MPKINVLSKETAELIAAGEVVERPASAIKEMVENSIDAGARHITVEIERGGIALMRITDDGCGIEKDDVRRAFLRHATSKIKNEDDLQSIGTLGFRGEALAAISAVAKVTMITKTPEEEVGTICVISGGEEKEFYEIGCAGGTVIEVRDLFYNTPARMKFLKKDMKEGANVSSVIDRIAVSHPEISFTLIKDGKTTLSTSGNGNLKDTVYSVFGRDIALGTLPIDYSANGVKITGLICKPFKCRPNRNLQLVYLNKRFVKSSTVMAALDVGYKNSAMVGKFPYCFINIEIPYDTVDVNVHPAKTEVRFSDESRIFDAVRYGVSAVLSSDKSRPEISSSLSQRDKVNTEKFLASIKEDIPEKPQEKLNFSKPLQTNTASEKIAFSESPYRNENFFVSSPVMRQEKSIFDYLVPEEKTETKKEPTSVNISVEYEDESAENPAKQKAENRVMSSCTVAKSEEKPVRFIGEVFKTYILAEQDGKLLLIDKHAAHERILFEKLKSTEDTVQSQVLLTPQNISLTKPEYAVISQNTDKLYSAGFDVDDFGDGAVLLRAVPSMLTDTDYSSLLSEIAESLIETNSIYIEKLDRIFHTVACKAAIKAGYNSTETELINLLNRAVYDPKIRYCPHGRPVTVEISEKELEKMFGRTGNL